MEGMLFIINQYMQVIRVKRIKALLKQIKKEELQIKELSKKQLFDVLLTVYSADFSSKIKKLRGLRDENQTAGLKRLLKTRLTENQANK